jgi:hypothetical protein
VDSVKKPDNEVGGTRQTELIFVQRVYKPSVPVSTPSVGYVILLGSNPKPVASASVLRNESKSKFSKTSGFSRVLKSRLKFDGCRLNQ